MPPCRVAGISGDLVASTARHRNWARPILRFQIHKLVEPCEGRAYTGCRKVVTYRPQPHFSLP